MKTAYLQICSIRLDGSRDRFATVKTDIKEKPLTWQTKGLSYTASGYGARVPTTYMVKFKGKWRRVYCRIYSNSGTLFLGKNPSDGPIVDIY